MLNEYRCTRNEPYQNSNCFGHTDLEVRQGIYIKAESEQGAIAQMAQLFPDDNAGFTAQLWRVEPVNTIKIEFIHEVEPPKYSFGDRVAVAGDCSPSRWTTGKVTGLLLDEDLVATWFYVVQLDSPSGFTDEYLADDLVPERFVPTLQSEWDLGEAAWIHANKEPETECDRCDGKGYRVDDRSFQSHNCSSCAGTGIKDFAKQLPPASLREEQAEV